MLLINQSSKKKNSIIFNLRRTCFFGLVFYVARSLFLRLVYFFAFSPSSQHQILFIFFFQLIALRDLFKSAISLLRQQYLLPATAPLFHIYTLQAGYRIGRYPKAYTLTSTLSLLQGTYRIRVVCFQL